MPEEAETGGEAEPAEDDEDTDRLEPSADEMAVLTELATLVLEAADVVPLKLDDEDESAVITVCDVAALFPDEDECEETD